MSPDNTIKDLGELRALFPEMEPYHGDAGDEQAATEPILSDKLKSTMKLYVSRDKKQRAGKQVTLIQGHEGPIEELNRLLSKLKALCSAGGSLKEGELIIQGDHVKKVIAALQAEGYKLVKQKGG